MGLAIDSKRNVILSVAEDKKFKITDILHQEALSDIQVEEAKIATKLQALEYDIENQRAFILNSTGSLFIYSLAEKPPKLVKQVNTGSAGVLRDLAIDYGGGYIFTCISTVKDLDRCDGWNDFSIRDWKSRKRSIH